jgi:hypothetical protein
MNTQGKISQQFYYQQLYLNSYLNDLAPQRDPNMEAILSKRSAQIENIYNKNLRPTNEKQDTMHRNDGNSAANSRRPSKDETARQLHAQQQQQQQIQQGIAREQTIEREKTLFSLNNYNFEADESGDEMSSNASVNEYESACNALQIVPCSIVLKALPTTKISLANYGFNSTGILALTHALKVNSFIY